MVVADAARTRASKVAVTVRRVMGLIWKPWKGRGGGGGARPVCDGEDSLTMDSFLCDGLKNCG